MKMYIACIAMLLLSISAAIPPHTASAALTDVVSVISAKPDHVHRVAAGTKTTFVLRLYNQGPDSVSAQAGIGSVSQGDWTAGLAPSDYTFQPQDSDNQTLSFSSIEDNGTRFIILTVTPPATAAEGQECSITVDAKMGDNMTGSVTVSAVVNNTPKVYILIIDACAPTYVRLDRQGNLNPDTGADLLMPNIFAFLQSAARFPDALDNLPAGTDPNNMGIFSGSWPGTSGVVNTGYYFKGWDADNNSITEVISSDELKYGPDGERVRTVFDVAKDPAYGGDNNTFTALIVGKFHVANLCRTGLVPTPTVLVTGQYGPSYLATPQPYVLGDPMSDADADTDRDGTNILPRAEYKMNLEGVGTSGDTPGRNPTDRWVTESALRILAAEDPDIFVIHMGNVDKMQHAAGAADYPQEWVDPGTPGIVWDDINIFNRRANREPVLDVIHEADNCTGIILNTLKRREVFDTSVVVVTSDHGQRTYMDEKIDVVDILATHGFADAARKLISWQEIAVLYLRDEYKSIAQAQAIASILEDYTCYHPVWQQDVNPFGVITQDEMLSGVDSGILGEFGRAPSGSKRGVLYSEWLIENTVDDNSQVIWPDILVFSLNRFQFTQHLGTEMPDDIGGHSGKQTMHVMLALKGPGFLQGVFNQQDATLVDIMPTIYQVLGLTPPDNVDGRILEEILP